MTASAPRGALGRPGESGPRRSTQSRRGEDRRRELLRLVSEDLERHGLVEFSLRRAARAAGTAHKVLIYHFGSVDELLAQALDEIRGRRISRSVGHPHTGTLHDLVRVAWNELLDEGRGPRVLDQATGLSLYDPDRYAALGRAATEQYLPALVAACPTDWPNEQRQATAGMVLATLRGLLLDALTSGNPHRANASLDAFLHLLPQPNAPS